MSNALDHDIAWCAAYDPATGHCTHNRHDGYHLEQPKLLPSGLMDDTEVRVTAGAWDEGEDRPLPFVRLTVTEVREVVPTEAYVLLEPERARQLVAELTLALERAGNL